jgi:hypothetical protein
MLQAAQTGAASCSRMKNSKQKTPEQPDQAFRSDEHLRLPCQQLMLLLSYIYAAKSESSTARPANKVRADVEKMTLEMGLRAGVSGSQD